MLIRKLSVRIAEDDFRLSRETLVILKKKERALLYRQLRRVEKAQAWNSKNSPPRLRLFQYKF